MDIGEKIKQVRKAKKLSQLELARLVSISNTYLSDIEVGRTTPSIKTLLKLAEALEIEPSIFLKS